MFKILKKTKDKEPQLRELDPVTIQRIKEGAYLRKLITESQTAARKCEYYAGNAVDKEVKKIFADEADKLKKSYHMMQKYYESMTME